jgi:CheB methylesterase
VERSVSARNRSKRKYQDSNPDSTRCSASGVHAIRTRAIRAGAIPDPAILRRVGLANPDLPDNRLPIGRYIGCPIPGRADSKENRTRPAINPLFRSAAAAYGERVTGVILTGLLDDGVAGLAEIKRQGGVAVAEDPVTALYPSMPYNTTLKVEMDFVMPLPEIAVVVSTLAVTERSSMKSEERMERILSHLTCPECRGPLTKERQGKIVEYRCRVGHLFSPLAMAQEHRDTVERSLWMSVLALEEAAEITEELAPELGPDALEDARAKRKQSADLRVMLNSSPAGSSKLAPLGDHFKPHNAEE